MKKKLFSDIDWFMCFWLAFLLFITFLMFQSCSTTKLKNDINYKVYTLEEIIDYCEGVNINVFPSSLPKDFAGIDTTDVYRSTYYLDFEYESYIDFLDTLYECDYTFIVLQIDNSDMRIIYYKDNVK